MCWIAHVKVTDDGQALLCQVDLNLQELHLLAGVLIEAHSIISIVAHFLNEADHGLDETSSLPNIDKDCTTSLVTLIE